MASDPGLRELDSVRRSGIVRRAFFEARSSPDATPPGSPVLMHAAGELFHFPLSSSVTLRQAAEVLALAKNVPGMSVFFALVGSAIQGCRSRLGLRMLVACGLERERAWHLIDGWERMVETESRTGWTPETTAMAFVINDVAGWHRLPWGILTGQFAVEASGA